LIEQIFPVCSALSNFIKLPLTSAIMSDDARHFVPKKQREQIIMSIPNAFFIFSSLRFSKASFWIMAFYNVEYTASLLQI